MERVRVVSRWLLGVAFVLAGVNHFRRPGFYVRIMPDYLPWHDELVALSGCAEIGLGLLVLLPTVSRLAGIGLIALLVAVFPANLHMALHANEFPEFNPTALWCRLPFQGVLIAWVYWTTLRSKRLPAKV